LLHRVADRAGVLDAVGERLLDVRILPRLHRLDAVVGVLEVRGRNDDRVGGVRGVHLLVVAERARFSPDHLFDPGHALVATPLPDVRYGDDLEVELLAELAVRGEVRLAEPVGEAHDADPHAIVGAEDLRVARGRESAGRGTDDLYKLPARQPSRVLRHVSSPCFGAQKEWTVGPAARPASAPRM